MQQKSSPSKGTFIALVVIAIVTLGLFFYYRGSPSDGSLSSLQTRVTPESAKAKADSDRILLLLNQINQLRIDSALFKSTVFNSLVDYSITIPEQPVGRANPFAPVGGFQQIEKKPAKK